MIAGNDLRIGNLFYPIDRRSEVNLYVPIPFIVMEVQQTEVRGYRHGISLHQVLNYSTFSIRDIDPIPLTPELLEKCGFIFDKGMNHWQHPIDESGVFIQKGLRIRNKEGIRVNHFTDGYFVETYYSAIEIKAIHQLQNLYYALTGNELGITF